MTGETYDVTPERAANGAYSVPCPICKHVCHAMTAAGAAQSVTDHMNRWHRERGH